MAGVPQSIPRGVITESLVEPMRLIIDKMVELGSLKPRDAAALYVAYDLSVSQQIILNGKLDAIQSQLEFLNPGSSSSSPTSIGVTSLGGRTGDIKVVGEVPSGVIDSANDTFTFTYPTIFQLWLFKNATFMKPGTDYALAGGTIVYDAVQIPLAADSDHPADWHFGVYLA